LFARYRELLAINHDEADTRFSEVAQPPGWKSERLYDLMVAIIEVQELEGWGSFIVETAILLDKTCPPTRPSLIRIMFRPHLPQTLTNVLVHIILGEMWGSV
jgi:hypothetical protein